MTGHSQQAKSIVKVWCITPWSRMSSNQVCIGGNVGSSSAEKKTPKLGCWLHTISHPGHFWPEPDKPGFRFSCLEQPPLLQIGPLFWAWSGRALASEKARPLTHSLTTAWHWTAVGLWVKEEGCLVMMWVMRAICLHRDLHTTCTFPTIEWYMLAVLLP